MAAAQSTADRLTPRDSPPARSPRRRVAVVTAFTVVVVVVWQLVVVAETFPTYMVPAPSAVLEELWIGVSEPWSSDDNLLRHLSYTIIAAAIGFGVGSAAGIVLGGLCAMSRPLSQLVRPYVFAFQSMPKIALIPLLMVWLGFGSTTKITIAAIIVFFPAFVNSYAGFTDLEAAHLRMFRSMRASRLQTLMQLRAPFALVPIFAGLELGVVSAQLGVVAAEFLAGSQGAGVVLIGFQYTNNTAGVIAILILLGATSVLLYRTTRALRKRLVYWEERA